MSQTFDTKVSRMDFKKKKKNETPDTDMMNEKAKACLDLLIHEKQYLFLFFFSFFSFFFLQSSDSKLLITQ